MTRRLYDEPTLANISEDPTNQSFPRFLIYIPPGKIRLAITGIAFAHTHQSNFLIEARGRKRPSIEQGHLSFSVALSEHKFRRRI